jgi:hypothetical protein
MPHVRSTVLPDQSEEEYQPHLAPVAVHTNLWLLVVGMGYHDAKQRQAQQEDRLANRSDHGEQSAKWEKTQLG